MVTRPIVAVDTETTGLHWSREAWEIGMVKRWPSGDTTDHRWLLEVDLRRADPQALELGGFYERHPRGIVLSTGVRPPFGVDGGQRAAEQIARWTHGATIIGAQPWFDAHVLANLLHRHEIQPAWHHRMVDVESLTAGHLGLPPVSLVDSAQSLGVEFPVAEQHTALGDARVCMAIWDRIVGGAS